MTMFKHDIYSNTFQTIAITLNMKISRNNSVATIWIRIMVMVQNIDRLLKNVKDNGA